MASSVVIRIYIDLPTFEGMSALPVVFYIAFLLRICVGVQFMQQLVPPSVIV